MNYYYFLSSSLSSRVGIIFKRNLLELVWKDQDFSKGIQAEQGRLFQNFFVCNEPLAKLSCLQV